MLSRSLEFLTGMAVAVAVDVLCRSRRYRKAACGRVVWPVSRFQMDLQKKKIASGNYAEGGAQWSAAVLCCAVQWRVAAGAGEDDWLSRAACELQSKTHAASPEKSIQFAHGGLDTSNGTCQNPVTVFAGV